METNQQTQLRDLKEYFKQLIDPEKMIMNYEQTIGIRQITSEDYYTIFDLSSKTTDFTTLYFNFHYDKIKKIALEIKKYVNFNKYDIDYTLLESLLKGLKTSFLIHKDFHVFISSEAMPIVFLINNESSIYIAAIAPIIKEEWYR